MLTSFHKKSDPLLSFKTDFGRQFYILLQCQYTVVNKMWNTILKPKGACRIIYQNYAFAWISLLT